VRILVVAGGPGLGDGGRKPRGAAELGLWGGTDGVDGVDNRVQLYETCKTEQFGTPRILYGKGYTEIILDSAGVCAHVAGLLAVGEDPPSPSATAGQAADPPISDSLRAYTAPVQYPSSVPGSGAMYQTSFRRRMVSGAGVLPPTLLPGGEGVRKLR
jgi:hypothetical protein